MSIIVNLDLLKFHSFKYDKKINNLWNKDINQVKDKIILDYFYRIIKHIKQFDKIEDMINDFKGKRNFHGLEHEVKNMLLTNIIKKCHPNLYHNIEQNFLEKIKIKDLKIYQISLTNRSRLIFIIDNEKIIPIIFDLKHCFYKYKRKNFDNNYRNENNHWSFKEEQDNLKMKLLKL